jgi:TfoX/Sxy family transcriptional regulator of competence genes
MAYDEQLDKRVTFIVADWGTTRRKMFGGTCHLLNGNMFCGVYQNFLVLRLGEKSAAEALDRPHVKPFDVTPRPMKGWVMVDSGVLTQADLVKWLNRARDYVDRLPQKQ